MWKSVVSHPKKIVLPFLCACWALKDERFYRFFSSPPLQKPFLPWIVSKSKYSWNTPYFWEYDMSRHLKTYFFSTECLIKDFRRNYHSSSLLFLIQLQHSLEIKIQQFCFFMHFLPNLGENYLFSKITSKSFWQFFFFLKKAIFPFIVLVQIHNSFFTRREFFTKM